MSSLALLLSTLTMEQKLPLKVKKRLKTMKTLQASVLEDLATGAPIGAMNAY